MHIDLSPFSLLRRKSSGLGGWCLPRNCAALTSRGSIFCDRELLRRAVENLLRNGIRYSPEDVPIDIHLIQNIRNVTITVRDYGLGVPDESLVQIFQPFFRVDEARDMDSGGVGLGLSIVKRVVHLHHGTVAAHNAHPGLSVEINLPR